MHFAQVILLIVGVYLAVGAVFAAAFVTFGIGRVDPTAHGAPLTFRMIIVPGVTALWPVLLGKWLRAGRKAVTP